MANPNLAAHTAQLRHLGMTEDQVDRVFATFNAASPAFASVHQGERHGTFTHKNDRVAIRFPHLARVEGEGAMYVRASDGKVEEVRLEIYEPPRFFEAFLRGRAYTLVLAAADVYKIKYESTLEAERVAKLRTELRREQDMIASLRAEWSKLDRPDRIQDLAQRHLALKPLETRQYDTLDKLPERPVELVPPGTADPIGARDRDIVRSRHAHRQRPEQANRNDRHARRRHARDGRVGAARAGRAVAPPRIPRAALRQGRPARQGARRASA